MSKKLKVAFLGLSHLGIVSSISLAAKKVECLGLEQNEEKVSKLNAQEWTIKEPGLFEAFQKAREFISFSSDLNHLAECDVVYISQDVPTDENGESNLVAIESLIIAAREKISSRTIIVILCQVPPGFTRRMSKLHRNIYYQVETLVFGDAFRRAAAPERIILGALEVNSPLDYRMKSILSLFSCPIILMDFESAELTKISINAFLASSVTTTNSLNEVARSIGANWNSIKKALQLDSRIGSHAYLTPGLGLSGGNIERDLRTLVKLRRVAPEASKLFRFFLSESERQREWLSKTIVSEVLQENSKLMIGILGISYKPNTHSTKNAMSIDLCRKFPRNIAGVYDPQAVLPEEFSNLTVFNSPIECIKASDAIVIASPWSEFANLDFELLKRENQRELKVIDPYSIVEKRDRYNEIKLIRLSAE
jgi:UDPglucose 6-dehydrogenase